MVKDLFTSGPELPASQKILKKKLVLNSPQLSESKGPRKFVNSSLIFPSSELLRTIISFSLVLILKFKMNLKCVIHTHNFKSGNADFYLFPTFLGFILQSIPEQ